jgi:molecular chaperone DnaK (HSP70)
MAYVLGIDIGGSTATVAACRRVPSAMWSDPSAVPLGAGSPAVASVLELTSGGTFVAGDVSAGDFGAGDFGAGGFVEASPGGPVDGSRVARGFLRRVGDETPLVVGGESYRAQSLVAALARWVVDATWERDEGPAEQVALTYPTGWGGYRIDVLQQALHEAGLAGSALLTRARAVAECHDAAGHLPATGVLAVYRLGGSSVETSLLARTGPGVFELLGSAELDIGGADLRDAPLAQLRPTLQATIDALLQVVRSCGVAPADVAAVLLAGGAASVPQVAEMISDGTGCRVLCDDDPQFTAARGAALAARRAVSGEEPLPAVIDYAEISSLEPAEHFRSLQHVGPLEPAPPLEHSGRLVDWRPLARTPRPASRSRRELAPAPGGAGRPPQPPVRVAELEAGRR